jgi:hypothetical protein
MLPAHGLSSSVYEQGLKTRPLADVAPTPVRATGACCSTWIYRDDALEWRTREAVASFTHTARHGRFLIIFTFVTSPSPTQCPYEAGERGVPVKVLDLRMCSPHQDDRAKRKKVTLRPEQTFEAREQMEMMRDIIVPWLLRRQ